MQSINKRVQSMADIVRYKQYRGGGGGGGVGCSTGY